MDRRTFVSMVTAGAASTLLRGNAAAAQPAPKARNVVLVHGLFADGSCWSEVIARLQAAGLNATAVQNPLTTLPEAVASAERVLARQDGPTVLVGHSFSGMIVTEAGVHPNVSAIVYVAARPTDAGEDYTALAKTYPTPPATAGIVFDGDEGRLSEEAFVRDFAGDLPAEKAKVLYAVQEPFQKALLTGKTTQAAWAGKHKRTLLIQMISCHVNEGAKLWRQRSASWDNRDTIRHARTLFGAATIGAGRQCSDEIGLAV